MPQSAVRAAAAMTTAAMHSPLATSAALTALSLPAHPPPCSPFLNVPDLVRQGLGSSSGGGSSGEAAAAAVKGKVGYGATMEEVGG